MDEKSMILEQERQQKLKERRKRRKWKWGAGIWLLALFAGGTWYMVQGRYLLAETDANKVEIVAGEGQEIVYARIDVINGNEVTYTVTDMPIMSMEHEDGSQSGSRTEGRSSRPGMEGDRVPEVGGMDFAGMEGGQVPEVGDMDFAGMEGGQVPEVGGKGFTGMEGGQVPEVGGMGFAGEEGGQVPEMGGMGFAGEEGEAREQEPGREDGHSNGKEEAASEADQQSIGRGSGKEQVKETESTESVTTYIPVGTRIITKLGTVTTFSRLAAGDYVAFVMEQEGNEEIIMAVYIVG